MMRPRRSLVTRLVMVLAALSWGADQGISAAATSAEAASTAVSSTESAPATTADAAAQATKDKPKGKVTRDQAYVEKFKRIAPSEQKKAAKLAAKRGLKPGIAGLQAAQTGIAGRAATSLQPGMAATAFAAAAIPDPGGVPHYFGPYGNWAFSPLPKGPVATVTVVDGGTGYSATPTVTVDDAYLRRGDFTPATVTATVDGWRHYRLHDRQRQAPGTWLPSSPSLTPTGTGALADAIIGGTLTGGIRKFVDGLPGLTPAGANNLGQYIPVAVPEPCTYSGQAADCYSIALVEYAEKMHSDLPATKLRGYVQLATAAVPGVHIRAPAESRCPTAPRRMVWTTPITSGPSSWPRAR